MTEIPFHLPRDEAFRTRRKFEELIAREVAMALPALGSTLGGVSKPPPQPGSKEWEVETGIIYPAALLGSGVDVGIRADTLVSPAPTIPKDFSALRIVDRYGHARSVYRPLLVYCLTQAFALMRKDLTHERQLGWRAMLESWQSVLINRADQLPWQEWPAAAARGAEFAEAAWIGLAIQALGHALGQTRALAWAVGLMQRLTETQQPGGAFLQATASDNPETTGYHELLILHAAASSVVQMHDAPLLGAVRRSALFHAAELQPDHATNQPWALFAFLLDPATFPVADGLISTAAAQLGHRDQSRLSLMLMADALYCLERVRGS